MWSLYKLCVTCISKWLLWILGVIEHGRAVPRGINIMCKSSHTANTISTWGLFARCKWCARVFWDQRKLVMSVTPANSIRSSLLAYGSKGYNKPHYSWLLFTQGCSSSKSSLCQVTSTGPYYMLKKDTCPVPVYPCALKIMPVKECHTLKSVVTLWDYELYFK